jgi:hypothetical protein
LLRDEVDGALRVRRARDLEAVANERHLEQVAGLLFVVDDQDLSLCVHADSPSLALPRGRVALRIRYTNLVPRRIARLCVGGPGQNDTNLSFRHNWDGVDAAPRLQPA